MRISKHDIPVKIEAPGALARQQTGFGDAAGYGRFGAEHFAVAAGTDLEDLLKGLEDDLCQSPHWGYLIDGRVTARYADGSEETSTTGDLFYWPPGHTVRADEDSELVLFSPEAEHTPVLEHINRKLHG